MLLCCNISILITKEDRRDERKMSTASELKWKPSGWTCTWKHTNTVWLNHKVKSFLLSHQTITSLYYHSCDCYDENYRVLIFNIIYEWRSKRFYIHMSEIEEYRRSIVVWFKISNSLVDEVIESRKIPLCIPTLQSARTIDTIAQNNPGRRKVAKHDHHRDHVRESTPIFDRYYSTIITVR